MIGRLLVVFDALCQIFRASDVFGEEDEDEIGMR